MRRAKSKWRGGDVRLLCSSDTHGVGDVDGLAEDAIRRKVDIMVLAGDVQTVFMSDNAIRRFRGQVVSAAEKLGERGIELVLVPGNHDFLLRALLNGELDERLPENLHLLADSSATVCGLRFYGTPWCPYINGRWCYEEKDENLSDRFMRMPEGVDVLVSHSPPRGGGPGWSEAWDVSMQHDVWRHFGSISLRKAIMARKPRLVACGHIHSGDHTPKRLGDSVVANVSLLDEGYVEAFNPTEFRIGRRVRFRRRIIDKFASI